MAKIFESQPLSREELQSTLAPFTSTVTADGDAGGNYFFDSGLIGSPDFFTFPTPKAVLILDGPAANMISPVSVFDSTTGRITVFLPYGIKITAGTTYRPLNASGGGGGGPLSVPKLIIGDLTVAADTTVDNDVVITGSLIINAGITYTVKGKLQVYGNIINPGTLICLAFNCGGSVDSTGGGQLLIFGDVFIASNLTFSAGISSNINGGLRVGGNIRNPGALTAFSVECGGQIDNTAGSSFIIDGDVKTAGNFIGDVASVLIHGNLFAASQVTIAAAPFVDIWGNCFAGNNFVISAPTGNAVRIDGDLVTASNLQLTGASGLNVSGDCQVAGDFINDSSATVFSGKLRVQGNITNGTGSWQVGGNCQCGVNIANAGGGTFYIRGSLNLIGDNVSGNGNLDNTGGGNIKISGDTYISGNLTNPGAGTITITGILRCPGVINAAAGTLFYQNVQEVQSKSTTIDLNQAAGSYDLFTGAKAPVMLESLVITMPNAAAGGALTSISIQTNDTTPQVFINSVVGLVANLTAENQLAWTSGRIRLAVGSKVRLTINGGATGVGYVCNVDTQFKGVIPGASLT